LNEKDFLYGCHSGIQKAIRRSDLDLAKTCFDAMWQEKEHRNWLKWRTTILAEEDCWQMLGELAIFYSSKPGDDEVAWRRMLYQLALVDKSKDTESLMFLAQMPAHETEIEEHPEMKDMRAWLARIGKDDPSSVAEELWEYANDGLSDYEKAAARLLKSRLYQGGMLADRLACLGGVLLIKHRGLKLEEIRSHMTDASSRYLTEVGRKPKTVNLPWDVFDMHTQVGMVASSVFMKRYAERYPGLDKQTFENAWFYFESAWNKYDRLTALKEKPSCFESMWWPILIKKTIVFSDLKPKQVKKLWDTEMSDVMKKLVEWAIEKRSKGN